MPQNIPSYPNATGKTEQIIIDNLYLKYPKNNIIHITALSNDRNTINYVLEKNKTNQINSIENNNPTSFKSIPFIYLDYTLNPRISFPEHIIYKKFVNLQFDSLYEYMLSNHNQSLNAVDLDYVWKGNSGWKGFELTTFYIPFRNENHARYLISQMKKRPSWQGKYGSRAFRKILDCAKDLNIDYYVVCMNTTNKVGSELDINKKVCIFKLDYQQINSLELGYTLHDFKFVSYDEFIKWL